MVDAVLNLIQTWPNQARVGQDLARFGTTSINPWPKSANLPRLGRNWAEVGQNVGQNGQCGSKFGQRSASEKVVRQLGDIFSATFGTRSPQTQRLFPALGGEYRATRKQGKNVLATCPGKSPQATPASCRQVPPRAQIPAEARTSFGRWWHTTWSILV